MVIKKHFLIIALIVAGTAGNTVVWASKKTEGTVRLVADEWCPYNCAPGDEAPGILIEIAKRALEKEGVRVQYEILPWARAIDESRQGKHDGIVGASVADAPDFQFPDTHQFKMKNAVFTLNESKWEYKDIASLNDVSLGVIRDYTYGDDLDAYVSENQSDQKKVQFASGEDALETNIKKLLAGRIGALIEDENVFRMFLRDKPDYQDKFRIAGYLPESPTSKIHVAFSPANENAKRYAELIAQETKDLEKSGEMQKIVARYLGESKKE